MKHSPTKNAYLAQAELAVHGQRAPLGDLGNTMRKGRREKICKRRRDTEQAMHGKISAPVEKHITQGRAASWRKAGSDVVRELGGAISSQPVSVLRMP